MRMCVCACGVYMCTVQAVIERGSLVGTAGACVAQGKGCEGGVHGVGLGVRKVYGMARDRPIEIWWCVHTCRNHVCAGSNQVWQARQGSVWA